jgi:predicted ATP-dependent serine protease
MEPARRPAGAEPDRWRETSVSGSVRDALEYARSRRGMAVICGAAGVGKSQTFERYADEVRDACRVVYVAAGGAHKSASQVLALTRV